MKQVVIIAMLLLVASVSYAQQGKTMYVAVKGASVKASTSFFAAETGQLSYGDVVTVVRQNGKWSEIRHSGKVTFSGWIATASLTSRRVVAGAVSSASASELALAGKGFSAEVETEFRKGNANFNYDALDAVERFSVPTKDLSRFITEGHLAGGAQ
jgi:uncharacterized protein YgiM (DUF1202 family)